MPRANRHRRLLEDLLGLAICAVSVALGLRYLRRPPRRRELTGVATFVYRPARMFLLVAMTFAYALELGYKLATRQFIFILNPCHVLCLVQVRVPRFSPFREVFLHSSGKSYYIF